MRATRVAGVALVVLGLLGGCASAAQTPPAVPAGQSQGAPSRQPTPGPQPIPAAAAVYPARVQVPAIGVDTTELEQLGRGPSGELNPPVNFDRAGYYQDGPTPGDPGPAVIAAHVDDTTGPNDLVRD